MFNQQGCRGRLTSFKNYATLFLLMTAEKQSQGKDHCYHNAPLLEVAIEKNNSETITRSQQLFFHFSFTANLVEMMLLFVFLDFLPTINQSKQRTAQKNRGICAVGSLKGPEWPIRKKKRISKRSHRDWLDKAKYRKNRPMFQCFETMKCQK